MLRTIAVTSGILAFGGLCFFLGVGIGAVWEEEAWKNGERQAEAA